MPNLLNRFKNKKFESNSAFQIRNQKEKGGAKEEQKKSRKAGAISHPCAKFAHHCAKFAHQCAKFSLSLFTFCHFYSLFPILPFMCISVN